MSGSAVNRCQEAGCPSAYGIQCTYVDQKDNHCPTYWCQEHVRVVDGTPYCRRHAPVVEALKNSHFASHFPDVNNRAPSLTNWMGNALDLGVRVILGPLVDPARGETLASQELTYYFILPKREHRWERAWKVVNPRSVKMKVAVQVDERDDSLVKVEVAEEYVMQIVPSWVIRRRERVSLDANAAMSEREDFYRSILYEIERAVGAADIDEQGKP